MPVPPEIVQVLLHHPGGAFLPSLCGKVRKFHFWEQVMGPFTVVEHQLVQILNLIAGSVKIDVVKVRPEVPEPSLRQ